MHERQGERRRGRKNPRAVAERSLGGVSTQNARLRLEPEQTCFVH